MPATREKPDEFRQVIDVNLNGCLGQAGDARAPVRP